jgi:hypothetical protein
LSFWGMVCMSIGVIPALSAGGHYIVLAGPLPNHGGFMLTGAIMKEGEPIRDVPVYEATPLACGRGTFLACAIQFGLASAA